MTRLRFSNADIRRIGAVLANRALPVPSGNPAEQRRWLSRTGPGHFHDLARVWLAEARVHEEVDGVSPALQVERVRALRTIVKSGVPLTISDLELDGEALKAMGLEPGPGFGDVLEYLLDRVLEDPTVNTAARLRELVRNGGFLRKGTSPTEAT